MNLINTLQFNLIGYLISVVGFFQFYKLAVKNAKHDGAATVLLQLIAGTAILLLSPFFVFKLPSEIKIYLLLFVSCVFYALNDRLQTTSRKNLQVSVFSIISQLTNVFLIIIGLVILKEPFVLSKLFGTSLILLGNVFILYKRNRLIFNRYICLGVLASFFLALAISIDVGISKEFNLPFYIMLTVFVPAIMIFIADKIKLSDIMREYKSKEKRHYLITGIFWALLIFFYIRALQLGETIVVVSFGATSVLLNVVVAYFVFKERESKWRKLTAAIFVILGVCLTVF